MFASSSRPNRQKMIMKQTRAGSSSSSSSTCSVPGALAPFLPPLGPTVARAGESISINKSSSSSRFEST